MFIQLTPDLLEVIATIGAHELVMGLKEKENVVRTFLLLS